MIACVCVCVCVCVSVFSIPSKFHPLGNVQHPVPPWLWLAHPVSTQLLPNMKTTYVSALLTCVAPILGLPSALSWPRRPQSSDCAKDEVTELISSITSDFVGKLDTSADEPCDDDGPISSTCTSDTIVYRRE